MSTATAGWLVDQLPRAMADDDFICRFVRVFEELAASLRARADGLEHMLDVGVAPPEAVRWIGSWVGLTVPPTLPEPRQRALVHTTGALLPWRGTKKGLAGLLEGYTGAPVEIDDTGGVFPAGTAMRGPKRVTVRLRDTGGLAEDHLAELIRRELPADAALELRVAAGHDQRPATAPPESQQGPATHYESPEG